MRLAAVLHPRSWRRPILRLSLPVTALMAGFVALSLTMLAELHHTAWQRTANASANLLTAVGQDIARNVELYNLSLQGVIEGLNQPGIDKLSPALRQSVLFDRATTAKYLGAIAVLNEKGDFIEVAGNTQPPHKNGADRSYFEYLRTHPDAGLYISEPLTSKLTGAPVIALARRIDHQDGSFAGVVVGTMKLAYFQDLFRQLQLGDQGAVNLFRLDGTLLMRIPYVPGQIGRNFGPQIVQHFRQAQTGYHIGVSQVDGVQRAFFFSRVGDLPLELSVAPAMWDIFAAWRRQAAAIALVLAGLCGTAIWLMQRLGAEWRQRIAAEVVVRDSESRYRLLADHAGDIIFRANPDGTLLYISPAVHQVLGHAPESMIGRPWQDFAHEEDRRLSREVRHLLRAGETAMWRLRGLGANGDPVWLESRVQWVRQGERDSCLVGNLRDITARHAAEQRVAAAQAELAKLAATDPLTKLPNRRRFDEALDQEWRRAGRIGGTLGLLVVDVDWFKSYNDLHGHQEGDGALTAVAGCIRTAARRPADLGARYGGEEFVVILPEVDLPGALKVAERLRMSVEMLNRLHEGSPNGRITVSIGAACAIPASDREPDTLFAEADAALYRAKAEGRNCVRAAQPEAAALCLELPVPSL